MSLSEHMRAKILAAIEGIPVDQRGEIYVVSLYVYDVEDDPRRPTITVGYNTERQVAACTPAPGREPAGSVASDAAEARWNYAFWLQNSLAVIGDSQTDPVGAALRLAWAKQRGFWYSDEEADRDFEAALSRVEPLTGEFVQLAVGIVQDLHRSGTIIRLFGRPVPVVIHELEYYDQIAKQNEEANPPGLVDEFARWAHGL